MIPLRDDQPISTFPIVTILLIAANVLIYVGQQFLPLEQVWALVPYAVTHNIDLNGSFAHIGRDGVAHLVRLPPGGAVQLTARDIPYGPSPHPVWLTIFTSMFLHGGLLHIGGNMLYLWIFGNNIEDVLGRVRFLLFYFACGLAASAAQIVINPDSLIPNVGASGAIAGVLGAYFVLYPNARVLSIVPVFFLGLLAEVRAFWVLLLWIVLNIFQGVLGLGMRTGGGVAHFAHIGGFFAGVLLILLLGGRSLAARQQRRATYPPPWAAS